MPYFPPLFLLEWVLRDYIKNRYYFTYTEPNAEFIMNEITRQGKLAYG